MVVMLIRTLLAARILDVPEFGLFSVGMLVSNSFCMLGCFGFYLKLQRELPMLIAKGRHVRGGMALHQTLALTVLGFVIILPLSLAGLFSVLPVFFAISLLNGFSQQTFLIVTLQSRSEGRAMRFAIENLIRSIAVLAIIMLSGTVYRTAACMLLAESVVTFAVAAWVYGGMCGIWSIKRKALWMGGAKGLSSVRWQAPLMLMASGVLAFIMLNGDRWIAASLLSRDAFALYAFAGVILISAQSLQSVINVSIFPELAKTYALFGCTSTARKAIRYSLIGLLVSINIAVPVFFLASLIIENFYPAYLPTQEFLSLFLLIASFRVSDFLSSFLIITGQERLLLLINIISIGSVCIVGFAYFGLDSANIHSLSIAYLATLVAIFNYMGCLVVTIHSSRAA